MLDGVSGRTSTDGGDHADVLRGVLADVDASLVAVVYRHAGNTLLRFESADDLLQGIRCEVLRRAAGFEYRGAEMAKSFVLTVARGYMENRRAHWSALKRTSSRLIRLGADSTRSGAIRELVYTGTGPSTLAARREQLLLAARAIARLGRRDREIVRLVVDGFSIEDIARELHISSKAAQRARHRAIERLRKAYRALDRRPRS